MYTDYDRYIDLCDLFINDGYITGFTRVIKKGKEATVLQCDAHPDLDVPSLALKLYKDSGYRNFKNDAPYLQGKVWDKRLLKRLKMVKNEIWVETEYHALETLYQCGVRVPKPYRQMGDGVLMEYIEYGGSDAPLLKDIRLELDEAKTVFQRILEMLDLMLGAGIVHGDLSAFNILYTGNGPVLIDFPQSVCISSHDDARGLFTRDVEHLCRYFSRYNLDTAYGEIADELWTRYYRY